MPPRDSSNRITWRNFLGPGFVVAATGVGAGDLIAASVAGRRYGLAVLWIVVVGAALKWVLNDGVARWQLATGTTLIEGWSRRLPRAVAWYFMGFLLLWSFLVAAALASACGVAASALWSVMSVPAWAGIHSVAGFLLVWGGRYRLFESIMQWLIATMFILVIACAIPLQPDLTGFMQGLFVPTVPPGSAKFLLGLMGGVGGSVTLLCYGYWIRERGWSGPTAQRRSLVDLAVAYSLSGLFGLAMIVIAAEATPADASGNALVLALAARLGELLGPTGASCFLIGFWCAVFSSLLGVWQGVPYLFADSLAQLRSRRSAEVPTVTNATRTPAYRAFLAYLAFPPLILLYFKSPLTIVVLYAITGAFFMPFLAAVLLVMNNRKTWVGSLRNGPFINALLVLSLGLFLYLFFTEASEMLIS